MDREWWTSTMCYGQPFSGIDVVLPTLMTLYRVEYRPGNKDHVVIDWLSEDCLECRPEAMYQMREVLIRMSSVDGT